MKHERSFYVSFRGQNIIIIMEAIEKMAEPNIFDYATKELSQDAFFAWLLMCAKDAENMKLKEKGQAFVKLLFGDGYKVDEVFLQEKNIDLLVILRDDNSNGKQVAAIIEDKTTSLLQKNQMVKYCNMLSGTERDPNFWSNLKRKYPKADVCDEKEIQLSFCLYIRSDYLFAREQRVANKQFVKIREKIASLNNDNACSIISCDELDEFFDSCCGDQLYDSFIQYYNKKRETRENAKKDWNSESKEERNTSLFTHIGQTQFFNAAFGPDKEQYYDLGTDMGWPWIALDILRDHPKQCYGISYQFRSDFCNKNGKRLCFEQYREEKEHDERLELKIDDLRTAVDLSKKIIELLEQKYCNVKTNIRINEQKVSNYSKDKSYDKKTIFYIIFDDSPAEVETIAEFVQVFTEEFRKKYHNDD